MKIKPFWGAILMWCILSLTVSSAFSKGFSGKSPSSLVTHSESYEFINHGTNAPLASIVGDNSVCEGEVAPYSFTFTAGYTYIWNVTGGTGTAVANNFTVTWGPPGGGTVSLIVKDALGNVVGTYSLPVTINSKPYPYITASFSPSCKEKKREQGIVAPGQKDTAECILACDSSIVVYSTPNNPGSSYTWTVIGAISVTPSGNTVTVYWGSPGAGLIRVQETNANGCVNTAEKCITIIESPDAAFTSFPPIINGVITVCLGQTVQFYDASTGSPSSPLMDWYWEFQDGSGETSTDKNPTHTFNNPGSYQVVMWVENECHCKDSFVVKVDVMDLKVPEIVCKSTVCAGGNDTYSTPSGCPSAVYNWTVTNGTIIGPSNGPSIQVQWGTTGPGTVSLSITGCESDGLCPGTATVVIPIITSTTTISGPDPACYLANATYSIPNMPGSYYTWTITNGFIIAGQGTEQVDVQWFSGTSGTISVTYYNPSLNCGGSATRTIQLRPQFFVSGQNAVCQGSTIAYTATSGGAGVDPFYQWVLTNSSGTVIGGFSGSNVWNINWTFPPGVYKITVTNNSGAWCNSPQSYFVNIFGAPPPVTSVSGPTPVCPGQSYAYTAIPNAPGTFVQWTVTNGTPSPSSGNTNTITWAGAGPYIASASQVSMTFPYCASAPVNYPVASKLPAPAPVISGPSPVCKNTTQSYSCAPTTGDKYEWAFTPGTATLGSIISGQGTPNITVLWNNAAGVATLGVTVTTCGVAQATSKNITVTNPPAPVITGPTSWCQNVGATFSTATSGTSWTWNWGDGTANSSGQNPPNHTWTTPGTYSVTLTVTDPNGCPGTTSVVQLINIKPAPSSAISTPSPTFFCPVGTPISTTMYVTSIINPGSTIQWYLNGGIIPAANGTSYTATAAGSYTAVVTNSNGCSTTSNIIVVATGPCPPGCTPQAGSSVNFTATKTACMTYQFNATVTPGRVISWNFGDQTGAGAVNPVSHTYAEPGYYQVILIGRVPKQGVPGDSCDVPKIITVVVPIEAEFTYEITCDPGSNTTYKVNFFDRSDYVSPHVINSWNWTFPGGTPASSTAQNPTGIVFTAGTTPTVTLTIGTTASGTYTCTYSLPVVIPAVPTATLNFPSSTCQGNTAGLFSATFSPVGSVINSYVWNFGDGATSGLPVTQRTYTTPGSPTPSGTFPISLSITDKFGCPRVFNSSIIVYQNTIANPVAVAASGPTTFCAGNSVNLTANPVGGTAPYTYLWSNVATTQTINATQTGLYSVEVKDTRGCRRSSNAVSVVVNPVPNPVIVGKDEYCLGENILLSAYQGSNYNYLWFIGGSSTGVTGPTFNQPRVAGTYNFQVQITNPANGCVAMSPIYPVIVHPLPPIPPVNAAPTPQCEGQPITLTATPTTFPYTFNWSNGATGNSTVVFNAGQYTATITDQYGCQSKGYIQVYELPDFSNLMTGCYEFCDTGDVTLVGPTPVGVGYSYQWYFNGNPIPGPQGTMKDYIIPVGQAGIYRLEITTSYGCTAISGDIDVTFIKCRNCDTEFFIQDIVCVIDQNGVRKYYFSAGIYNPFPGTATYSLFGAGGGISGLSPLTLNPGMNYVTGFYTDYPPANSLLCLTGAIYWGTDAGGQQEVCLLKEFCRPLPDCPNPEPCQIRNYWVNVVCVGHDANGNPIYYFDYHVDWFGSNNSPIVGVTAYSGTITNLSINAFNTGSNDFSGLYTYTGPADGEMCFEIFVFDPKSRRVCSFRDCVRPPRCREIRDCKESRLKHVDCGGVDQNGNPIYKVHFDVFNPFGTGASIYMTTPQGGVNNISPPSIGPGWNGVDFEFTDLSPTGSSVCITLIIQSDDGQVCTQTICFELPDCGNSSASPSATTGIKDASSIKAGTALSVVPNPVKDMATISYVFKGDHNNRITVSDMYGKVVTVYNDLTQKGDVYLYTDNLAPGVYIVNAYTGEDHIQSKRVVVIK